MRGMTLVLFLATSVLAANLQGSIDREKLEAIRKMSPAERDQLKARLQELKKLPAEERERLKQNLEKIKSMPVEEVKKLREREKKLSPDEQKEFGELAMGFFKWAHRNGTVQGFPRGMFFQWLKVERPEKMNEIREMGLQIREQGESVVPRVNEFIKLSYEFRDVLQARTEQHVQRHKCVPYEEMHALRDAAFRDFWPRWQEVTRSCPARRANPGPVPPRPIDGPRK